MAWEQGTAANYIDLLDKLRLFLTTNTNLVNAGQAWTTLDWSGATEKRLIIEGPGRPGAQPVTLGFQTAQNQSIDSFIWYISGMVAYAGSGEIDEQPGASSTAKRSFNLWNSSIPYYFIANGARVMVVAQVSTYFMFGYFGHIIPYAAPSEMPQPILIAGTASYGWSRYSDSGTASIISPKLHASSSGALNNDQSPAVFRRLDGSWWWWGSVATDSQNEKDNGSFDLSSDYDSYTSSIGVRMGQSVDDKLILDPIDIIIPWDTSAEGIGVLGVLEGAYKTNPSEATPGSTVVVDSRTFLICNNVWRLDFSDFIALELS